MAMLSVQVKQMPTVLLAISIGKLIEMPTEKNKQTNNCDLDQAALLCNGIRQTV